LHIGPLLQAFADEAIIRRAINSNEFRINLTIAPLPITSFETSLSAAQDLFLVFILAVLGFPMVAGAFGAFIVAERESKAKHLQTVAGVTPEAYWLSTIVWDTLNYQIPMWITIALFFIFRMTAFTTSDRGAFAGIVLLLFLYGPASAAYTYCLTFLFKSPSLCTLTTVVSNFLFGMGGPVTLFIMELLTANPNGETDLRNVITILTWALRFNPTFCLGKGIFYVLNIQFFVYIARDINLSAFDSRILLWDIIFLVIHILVYMPLAVQIDKWSTNPSVMAMWKKLGNCLMCKGEQSNTNDRAIVTEVDSDVAREEDRVQSGEANSDLIVLSKMSKVYNNGKRAVDNVSLGIPPGQCFGLLGINGAGKTTTMAMLTAEFPPTSGDASLAGFSVLNEPQKTRRRIGYCPQFDAHFVNMTGREHLEMYAAIKGVPLSAVKEAAAEKLNEIGLSAYDGDRLCSTYSGGMRRRLSLGIATVGSPQIVFLDECSTGVDPVARREIWELVSDIVSDESVPLEERASVILTTHSMEECEALCPRIGIMANGRLRCLGSAQHLKNKFGQGYQVEIKISLVKETDDDFVWVAAVFAESNRTTIDGLDSVHCNLSNVLLELRKLTNDESLSSLITSDNPIGYSVWKDANSPQGATLESLAVFAASELRMQKIDSFLRENFTGLVLRERQDLKVRYEVSSMGTRISSIFTQIEDKKVSLCLDDYSVSQTSLEQVFNMHAAEAEKVKQGQNDR
jgi:ATP-binding cassette, subfamily A (ABC1), member 3